MQLFGLLPSVDVGEGSSMHGKQFTLSTDYHQLEPRTGEERRGERKDHLRMGVQLLLPRILWYVLNNASRWEWGNQTKFWEQPRPTMPYLILPALVFFFASQSPPCLTLSRSHSQAQSSQSGVDCQLRNMAAVVTIHLTVQQHHCCHSRLFISSLFNSIGIWTLDECAPED